jgi:hypothetical protein
MRDRLERVCMLRKCGIDGREGVKETELVCRISIWRSGHESAYPRSRYRSRSRRAGSVARSNAATGHTCTGEAGTQRRLVITRGWHEIRCIRPTSKLPRRASPRRMQAAMAARRGMDRPRADRRKPAIIRWS